MSEQHLADRYGPQWCAITALVDRAATLTIAEARLLAEAWVAERALTRVLAWDAAQHAARVAAHERAWTNAREAAWTATRRASGLAIPVIVRTSGRNMSTVDDKTVWAVARDAAWDAAGGLAVRDLIGQHRLTREHYTLLTQPWAGVIGHPHPEDAPTPRPDLLPLPGRPLPTH